MVIGGSNEVATLTGTPLIRKYMEASQGQKSGHNNEVAVLTSWPYGGVSHYSAFDRDIL